jgi:hypothetical protein
MSERPSSLPMGSSSADYRALPNSNAASSVPPISSFANLIPGVSTFSSLFNMAGSTTPTQLATNYGSSFIPGYQPIAAYTPPTSMYSAPQSPVFGLSTFTQVQPYLSTPPALAPLSSLYSPGLAARALAEGIAPTDYIYSRMFEPEKETLSATPSYFPEANLPGGELVTVGTGGVAGLDQNLLTKNIQLSIETSNAERIKNLQPDPVIQEMATRGVANLNANERSTYAASQQTEMQKAKELEDFQRNIGTFSDQFSYDLLAKAKTDPTFAEKYFEKQGDPGNYTGVTFNTESLPAVLKDLYGVSMPEGVTDPNVKAAYDIYNSQLNRGISEISRGSYGTDRLTAFSLARSEFRNTLDAALAVEGSRKLPSDNGVVLTTTYQNNPNAALTAINAEIVRAKTNGAGNESTYLKNLEDSKKTVTDYLQTGQGFRSLVTEFEQQTLESMPDPGTVDKKVFTGLSRQRHIIQSELNRDLRSLSSEASGEFGITEDEVISRQNLYIQKANQEWENAILGLDETHKKGFLWNEDAYGDRTDWNWDNIMAGSALLLTLYQGTYGRERDRRKQQEDMMKLERFRTDEALRLYAGRAEIGAQYRGGGGGRSEQAKPQGPQPEGSTSVQSIADAGGFG